MTSTICPLYEDAYYSYSVNLSGESYTLTFRWSDRCQQWMMDIEDSSGEVILLGVTLVPYFPLIQRYSLEKPLGEFYLVAIEKTSLAIQNPREIYKTHFLVYDDTII